jgi:alkylhydroperoxidase family enzyme
MPEEENTRSTEGIAWIRHVDPKSADGELAAAYGEIGARDRVAAILGVQSLHPAAMAAHARYYREIMFGDPPLTRTEREAIAVVVSALKDCFY